MTTNEEQLALRKAIDAMPPLRFAFDAEQRAMLLQHYTGMAMQAALQRTGGWLSHTTADECVAAADETIRAIERFYTLAITPSRGHG